MKIPKLLKIGGIVYKVIEKNMEESCGECDRTTNTIILNKEMTQEQKEVTLIHEILHALNWEFEEIEIGDIVRHLESF